MEAISQACTMKNSSHQKFRSRVSAPYSAHIVAALCRCQLIHHGIAAVSVLQQMDASEPLACSK